MRIKPNTKFGKIESELKAKNDTPAKIRHDVLTVAETFVKVAIQKELKHVKSEAFLRSHKDDPYYKGMIEGIKRAEEVVREKLMDMADSEFNNYINS